MTSPSRRNVIKAMLGSAALPAGYALANSPANNNHLPATADANPNWGNGPEGQRKADLGNGTFRNPIISGDHADPTILKDGENYYMTFSSFLSYPGIIIWHSIDLINWTPVGPALFKPLGSVWALDLCKHQGRYFIYIPCNPDKRGLSIFVIWADNIAGPWSEPIDLKITDAIDPGHVVGEDGKRYLFVNGIRKVRLTDDGLATDGPLEAAYQPWRYPEDWVVENFAPEGPKLLRRNSWFYLITAVGGTAGPVTGHMVIAARSRSIHGPWEHCPRNPLVRTTDVKEPWWSRGHATAVEGPDGSWWLVYHGYENGYRTLGRQVLLEPMEWTADGWFRVLGGDLSRPLRAPVAPKRGPSGFALSDDFSTRRFGVQWAFHDPAPNEMQRVSYEKNAMLLRAKGQSALDTIPLTCSVGDRSYETEVTIELIGEAEGGLLLFYNQKAFVGIGFTPEHIKTYQYAEELGEWARQPNTARTLRLCVTNDNHVITYRYSQDGGRTWQLHFARMEVSGIHHNVFGGFLCLKVGIYSAGSGSIRLSQFTYRARNS
jgi:xylan 1,4-beta-xylosidase